MKIIFIRHGLTKGNLEKRYIGATDEPLCSKGIAQLKTISCPPCDILICSPMKRCIQTAKILFPQQEITTDSGLKECDFGDFEGKNYAELSDSEDYQKWIDSGGNSPFPNGESPAEFRKRCIQAYEALIKRYCHAASAAFIVHGGTIMSILEKYAVPHKDYFDWHCENGHGYICERSTSELHILERI